RVVTTPDTPVLVKEVALYSNVVSNRMYGPVLGCGHEVYLGHGFAVAGELTSSLLLDVVKTRAKYLLQDPNLAEEAKKANTEYRVVPHLAGNVNLFWYPIEGVQMRIGYNALLFFNTLSEKDPVDFNFGGLNPPYQNQFRILQGLNVGIGLIF